MVGSLLHAARATCPNIAHAVGIVSKFNSEPTVAHLTAAKRIYRYLKGTLIWHYTMRQQANSYWVIQMLIGPTIWKINTRQLIMFLIMSGGAVSWLSQKQSTVALSTAESEYIALGSAIMAMSVAG